MIIVVSDVHLGYDKCNRGDFLRFLDDCRSIDIDHLVLLGDIMDFWRKNDAEIITNDAGVLAKLTNLNVRNIHYIPGNHDYYLLRLNERYAGNYPFTVSKYLRLEDDGCKFYFIHGYELEVLANLEPLSIEEYEKFSEMLCFSGDVLGWFYSHLWSFLQGAESVGGRIRSMKKVPHERENIDKIYNFAISEGAYMLLGMKPEEKLVFGHTHRPFITKKGNVANTGSWVDELPKSAQNSYVEISKGEMKLKFFK
jgi:UDP-2,3-diacylglucosamine pyrophosphatase LpxH